MKNKEHEQTTSNKKHKIGTLVDIKTAAKNYQEQDQEQRTKTRSTNKEQSSQTEPRTRCNHKEHTNEGHRTNKHNNNTYIRIT